MRADQPAFSYSLQGCKDLALALTKNHGLEGAFKIAAQTKREWRSKLTKDTSNKNTDNFVAWTHVHHMLAGQLGRL